MAMKPILVSGAGLGGLLLARSLRSASIPCLLFERDAHVASRSQGYRIRISSDGINALRAVLTRAEFDRFKQGTAEAFGGGINSLDAITGEADDRPNQRGPPRGGAGGAGGKNESAGPDGDVLGVARGFLRSELIRGLEDQVQWNKQVTGYERLADGVRAIFADGSKSSEGSLLVAADGAHSAITRQLTHGKVRAYDTGARMIHGQTHSGAFAGLGEGVWFATDTTSHPDITLRLITNVRPGSLKDPSLELGWVFVGSPGSFDAPNGDFSVQGTVAADISRRLTKAWHPKIRVLFEQQNDDEAAFLKMTTASPDGVPEWDNDSRVTLVGDAVHCMTPAGGVGANTALKDAEFLGRLIRERKGWEGNITAEYEKVMRVYASENVRMSFGDASKRFKITNLK